MPFHVIILSELYLPAESGTGFLMGKIAEGVATRYPVTVLCGYPPDQCVSRIPAVENRNGVIVRRCAGTKFNKNKVWLRTLNLFTISFSIFLKAMRTVRRGDKVLVVTNPPSLPFFASIVCKLRQAKCYLLIHDLYPEVLTAAGLLVAESLTARSLDWLNTWLYKRMEKVIVLGRDMSRIVARRHHPVDSRVVIIPNWADVDEIVPLPRKENTFLAQLDILGKFVIQYAGNMGRTHGIENLLASARMLQNRNDIHFLFVGEGAKRQWLEESVKAFGLGTVTILPLQPRRKLCELLNACDAAVISFIPGMAGLSVPSRMYTIMAAGKPIIAVADEDSELALVVREEEIGWVVPPDRPELLIEVIQRSQSEPDVAQEMGKRARRVAEQKYSFKRVLETYQNLFAIQ
ncbi:MAG: hypothetical protein HW389_1529 [Bacteroidetes bacterium]|nr:hypothetical protein [Bacteroidota bacterium]